MSDDDREMIDVKGVQRIWQPRLVELTQSPHPNLHDGAPTKLFLDPSKVILICCSYIRNELMDGTKEAAVECTYICMYGGVPPAHVLEAPEEVARRVQAAMREKS